jgi:carbonic anhydrase
MQRRCFGKNWAMPPTSARKLAVVTCMDARVNVERVLGLKEGDAHVIRNAGALVTDDVLRSLEASRELGTEEVVLILHTDCAARNDDLDGAVRAELARLEAGPRGFVYEVDSGELREVA